MISLKLTHFVLALLAVVLVGFHSLSASWTPAEFMPPNGNAATPLNTSSTTQSKTGNLAAVIFAATGEMRSNQYCDEMGQNCFSPGMVLNLATATPQQPQNNNLVFNQHTHTQCTAAGGTVHNTGSVYVCQFNGASCPSGWARYEQWGATAARSCRNATCGGGCTTGFHGFANMPIESCQYQFARDTARGCDFGGMVTCTAAVTQVCCY